MTYDPEHHHRRSIRLRGYDYAQAGAYFVTVCVEGRECSFGTIIDGVMRLNDAGRMVERWWLELNNKYPTVDTDEYSVMPNHFHGVILITADDVGAALCGRPIADESGQQPLGHPHGDAPTDDVRAPLCGRPITAESGQPPSGHPHRDAPTDAAPTLGDVVGWFKTMTTNEYIRGVKTLGWPPFNRRVWQRNYYEHIIRSGLELDAIRAYIATNPLRWALDAENPLTRKATVPEAAWQR